MITEAEYLATLCATCGTYGDRPHNTHCEAVKVAPEYSAISAPN